MTVTAKVICDSINPACQRLTTFVINYPRFLLAELNTHRQLSRSTASSRAIPVAKRIQAIKDDPVIPRWGMNKPGMQADVEVDDHTKERAEGIWLDAMNYSIEAAKLLIELGIHKQVANRLLEPFCHVSTVLSATDWENFFALRWHPDAQPEFYDLACAMKDAFLASKPIALEWGEWHLPFISDNDVQAVLGENPIDKLEYGPLSDYDDWYLTLTKASAARCARVSYENHDGSDPVVAKDLVTAERLLGSFPVHSSPCEHQAYACKGCSYGFLGVETEICDHGNFHGFHQFRKTLKNENITVFPWDSKIKEEIND